MNNISTNSITMDNLENETARILSERIRKTLFESLSTEDYIPIFVKNIQKC